MRFAVFGCFPPNNSSWPHQRCPRANFDFFAFWLSYKHFKMTTRCPRHRRVETPRCPKYRGVAIVDLLKIQKSPKCWRVETYKCNYITLKASHQDIVRRYMYVLDIFKRLANSQTFFPAQIVRMPT